MLTLTNPRQHNAELLREAAGAIGLAVPPDPLASMVKPQKWHQARLGRRRSFMSTGDADAYDRGYREYPRDDYNFPVNTPYSCGWFDAEKRATVAE